MRIKLVKDKAPFKAPIQGCEQFEDYENVRLGLDWFMKFNPSAYMILLD